VATGVLNVWLGWNGLSFSVAAITVDVTVYPPFLIALLLTVWLGPGWGVVPLYLANLASALASGLTLGMSAVFALAAPVELILIWGSMVLLNVDPSLRTRRDLMALVAISLIAATASSLATPIWNAANQLDFVEGLRVWRGWVVGDLAQVAFIAAPVLALFSDRVRFALVWRFPDSAVHPASHRAAVAFVTVIFFMLGALAFVGVRGLVAALQLDPGTLTPGGDLLLPRLEEIGVLMMVVFVVLMLTAVVYTGALARLSERDRRLALRDPLTGALNRRAFPEIYEREAARSQRLAEGLAVLFLDLDHFKRLNDGHGHVVGDLVLQHFSRLLAGLVRDTDFVFRWGGEEFLVLLPHTSPDEAPVMAERIRGAVEAEEIAFRGGRSPVRLTVSIGAAGTLAPPLDPAVLIAGADSAAYRAKERGRNCVEWDAMPGPD
jgi:diguanylate cyclase (GGDEF)-like protein